MAHRQPRPPLLDPHLPQHVGSIPPAPARTALWLRSAVPGHSEPHYGSEVQSRALTTALRLRSAVPGRSQLHYGSEARPQSTHNRTTAPKRVRGAHNCTMAPQWAGLGRQPVAMQVIVPGATSVKPASRTATAAPARPRRTAATTAARPAERTANARHLGQPALRREQHRRVPDLGRRLARPSAPAPRSPRSPAPRRRRAGLVGLEVGAADLQPGRPPSAPRRPGPGSSARTWAPATSHGHPGQLLHRRPVRAPGPPGDLADPAGHPGRRRRRATPRPARPAGRGRRPAPPRPPPPAPGCAAAGGRSSRRITGIARTTPSGSGGIGHRPGSARPAAPARGRECSAVLNTAAASRDRHPSRACPRPRRRAPPRRG